MNFTVPFAVFHEKKHVNWESSEDNHNIQAESPEAYFVSKDYEIKQNSKVTAAEVMVLDHIITCNNSCGLSDCLSTGVLFL